MSKKATPVPVPVTAWYFRDRVGHLFGPYTDPEEVRQILKNHRVDVRFFPETWEPQTIRCRLLGGYEKRHRMVQKPGTEYVMQDQYGRIIDPVAWRKADNARHVDCRHKIYHRRYRAHVYRDGPVAGIHKPRYRKMWRTPNFGRKVRDTGHGYPKDGEPPIRVKLRVRDYAWDDFAPCRTRKSWKHYRKHQWR